MSHVTNILGVVEFLSKKGIDFSTYCRTEGGHIDLDTKAIELLINGQEIEMYAYLYDCPPNHIRKFFETVEGKCPFVSKKMKHCNELMVNRYFTFTAFDSEHIYFCHMHKQFEKKDKREGDDT